MAKVKPHKRQPVEVNWKEVLGRTLKILGLTDDKFDGELYIKCKQGGVRNARRTEELD